MKTRFFILSFIGVFIVLNIYARPVYESDTIPTNNGNLIINFIGHGTLYFVFNDLVIHVDPVGRYADYTALPKADIILVTHEHGDHFDKETIKTISKTGTEIIFTQTCADSYDGKGTILKNGEKLMVQSIEVKVVPAYNLVNKRETGEPFHPVGRGNGYVITFNNVKVYIAGDTENVPEMSELKDVNIAFLPMNLPYTMTPEMVVNAVEMLKPKILYPYHFGNTNTDMLLELMKGIDYCEVRIRRMQ
jgi:L-ascorbate metabolism protein UlaG (beta-lactamase superfamily)